MNTPVIGPIVALGQVTVGVATLPSLHFHPTSSVSTWMLLDHAHLEFPDSILSRSWECDDTVAFKNPSLCLRVMPLLF